MLSLLYDLFDLGDTPCFCLGKEALELHTLGLAVLLQAQGDLDRALSLVLACLLTLVQFLAEPGDFRAQEELACLLVGERAPERSPGSLKSVHRNAAVRAECLAQVPAEEVSSAKSAIGDAEDRRFLVERRAEEPIEKVKRLCEVLSAEPEPWVLRLKLANRWSWPERVRGPEGGVFWRFRLRAL